MRLRHWFYLINFGLLAALAGAAWQDYNKDWRKYQKEYYRMAAEEAEKAGNKAEAADWRHRPVEIKQIILTDLNRVDRCTTCHVGMDEFANPSLTNDFKQNPYKAHPDIAGLVKDHPFRKFGCTECHAGQGIATDMDAAHGDVEAFETQVMKEPFIEGSCAKCHANFESLRGAQTAALGKKLFDKNGCIGCHSINGAGGVISVDLGDIADKPTERIAPANFDVAKMPPQYSKLTVKNWILAHLTRDPMLVTRNDPEGRFNPEPIAPSGMPPFYKDFKKGDAEAITTYLLSLTHEAIPKDYYVYAPPKREPAFASDIEHGHFVFQKYGCAACHGIDAKEGRRLFNGVGPGQDASKMDDFDEMAKGREPTLVNTVSTYNRDELRAKIQNGVPSTAIVKFNPSGPTPPAYMPAWKEKIKGKELEDLISWLMSIGKKQESW